PGSTTPVEVGVVSGLGMGLVSPDGSTGSGRVEFEGFEAVNVKLGTAGNIFTVGGNAIRGSLPRSRLPQITSFVSTITGMNVISGGSGSDTIKIIDTNQVPDRDPLNVEQPANLTLLSASTTTVGDATHNAVQQLMVSQAAHGVGYFTIGYRYEETKPIR